MELADWAWSREWALQTSKITTTIAAIAAKFLRAERAVVPVGALTWIPSSRLRPDELLVISKVAWSLIGSRTRRF